MLKDATENSDCSTDLQDTSGSTSSDSSESMEDSEDLNRTKKTSRGRPRKNLYTAPESAKRACIQSKQAEMCSLLRGLEQEMDVSIVTPLTSDNGITSGGVPVTNNTGAATPGTDMEKTKTDIPDMEKAETDKPDTSKPDTDKPDTRSPGSENGGLGTYSVLQGGRIMLPLSPFLKPRIHFPVSPLTTPSGEIRADLQEKIYNHQYINKGLASTIQYQMYLNNLILMNRLAHSEKKLPPQRLRKDEVRSASTPPEPKKKDLPIPDAPSPLPPARHARRQAALRRESLQKVFEPDAESDKDEEEDRIEKILHSRNSHQEFYVKYRGKSYLHCEWVPRKSLEDTKIGEMRVRRFLKTRAASEDLASSSTDLFDPEFLLIERVIAEEEEFDGLARKIYLVKWKRFPYESSTFEYYEHVSDCEGFEEAHGMFVKRKEKAYVPNAPLFWRPSRDRVPDASGFVFRQGRELREYQREGLSWLLNKWLFRQSCILADEMGLGKTVQSVTFVDTVIRKCGQRRPTLVVVPLSTIPNWEREFAAWTDLRVLVYHGSLPAREIMHGFEFRAPSGALLFDVLLTTYEMVIAGIDHVSDIQFGISVLDEAHRLKNSKSKASLALRQIEIDHKVLLSGTPLQNNLGELWSLLNFIDPEKFPSLDAFLSAHRMEHADDVEKIQVLLRPLMLRRMKDDVESIPVKEETIVEVELTMIQKRFYRAILEKNIEFLGAAGTSAPNLLNVMMELRKCCIHPYLISGAEEQILLENGKSRDLEKSDRDQYFRLMVNSSGKLLFLEKLLDKLHGKHKVLVFSQMTRCLDLIADYLQFREYPYERIDGTVRGDIRQASIDRFTEDASVFVFLLCTRAGGVGINLTAADTVIIFDSDWNPQNDLQAQARCHRIGQTSEVKIYRLITRNTYEREMFDRASMKLGLDRAILHKDRDTPSGRKGRVESLLRKGAYGVLMEADEVNERFCNEDIDAILEGRTRVVRHEDQGGNIFSKATFQVAEEIDDPYFWDNLLVKRRAADAESRLRRILRKMSRLGLFSPDEEKNREDLLELPNAPLDLLVELRGTRSDPQLGRPQIAPSIKRALHALADDGLREDFGMGLEWAAGTQLEGTLHPDVDPQRLLFRCQVSELLGPYGEMRGATEIEWKQWTVEDDDLLVRQTLQFGYGCYRISTDEKTRVGLLKSEKAKEAAVYKGRTRDELSARLRKILVAINKKEDSPEEKVSVSAAIETFGRPSDWNREHIIKAYRGRNIITEMTTMIETIEQNMKKRQSRRGGFDAELAKVLTSRISLFDKLSVLLQAEIPGVRKTPGLPRGWGRGKDAEMVSQLLATGLSKKTVDVLQLPEEVIIRRAEALIRNAAPRE